MNQLVKDLEHYNSAYRAGSPEISDAEYDLMIDGLKSTQPDHPFLAKVEEEPSFGAGKIRHIEPMLSTDKAYEHEDVRKFVTKALRAASSLGIPMINVTFRATPKLDGMASKRMGDKLVTRGDGLIGNDVSSAFSKGVVDISEKEGDCVGEIVMVQSYFDAHLAKEFSHPRNVVVGVISSDNPNPSFKKALSAGAIHFAPYHSIASWEGNGKELLENLDAICKDLSNCGYPIDGTVIEVTNFRVKAELGSTNHHHNWQIAKKERGESAHCKVLDVSWQIGRTGRVTPVINIDPTEISGAVISNVTGHHAANIIDKGIGTGSVIEVVRSGEVIPFLSRVVEVADSLNVPSKCPSCESDLLLNDLFLECHSHSCSAQTKGKVIHWFNILGNVDGFGPSAVDKLIDAGFDTPLSIYEELTEQKAKQAGFGPGQAKNLISELERSRTDLVDDWRLLASFGIHRLGRGDSKKLLRAVSIYDLKSVTESLLLSIDGFGPISAKSISQEIAERIDYMNSMLEQDFNLVITGDTVAESSPITGKHIVFTGGMVKGTRDAMKTHAESLGAIPQSSINKKTQILVAGNKASAAKVTKAEGLGAVVYDEDGYLALLGKK